MDDVILNKAEIIERAIVRVNATYARAAAQLATDFDAQDVILLNLQRACEASIDLAIHIVRRHQLGLPKDSRDAFTLLEQGGHISGSEAESLRKMVAFRNVAAHDYRALDWAIVRAVIEKNLSALSAFAQQMIKKEAT